MHAQANVAGLCHKVLGLGEVGLASVKKGRSINRKSDGCGRTTGGGWVPPHTCKSIPIKLRGLSAVGTTLNSAAPS